MKWGGGERLKQSSLTQHLQCCTEMHSNPLRLLEKTVRAAAHFTSASDEGSYGPWKRAPFYEIGQLKKLLLDSS